MCQIVIPNALLYSNAQVYSVWLQPTITIHHPEYLCSQFAVNVCLVSTLCTIRFLPTSNGEKSGPWTHQG